MGFRQLVQEFKRITPIIFTLQTRKMNCLFMGSRPLVQKLERIIPIISITLWGKKNEWCQYSKETLFVQHGLRSLRLLQKTIQRISVLKKGATESGIGICEINWCLKGLICKPICPSPVLLNSLIAVLDLKTPFKQTLCL